MSALKPCPFCGGEALYTPTCHIDVVQCRVCGAQGMAAMGQPEAAIAAWNRRAGADEVEKLRAELAAAREALRNAADAIERADPEILTCTLWMPDDVSPNETVVDHLRTALGDTP